MAAQSTLRNPWKPLLHPQHTHVLCPKNLCPTLDFIGDFSLDFCRSSAEAAPSRKALRRFREVAGRSSVLGCSGPIEWQNALFG